MEPKVWYGSEKPWREFFHWVLQGCKKDIEKMLKGEISWTKGSFILFEADLINSVIILGIRLINKITCSTALIRNQRFLLFGSSDLDPSKPMILCEVFLGIARPSFSTQDIELGSFLAVWRERRIKIPLKHFTEGTTEKLIFCG